jgi:hypothetical protein
VVCAPEGEWDFVYPELDACPADLPAHHSLCAGGGACTYEVDVGCGPANIGVSSSCLDASYLFQFQTQPPPLCDCTVIRERALCERYPLECSWSEDLAACEPLE